MYSTWSVGTCCGYDSQSAHVELSNTRHSGHPKMPWRRHSAETSAKRQPSTANVARYAYANGSTGKAVAAAVVAAGAGGGDVGLFA